MKFTIKNTIDYFTRNPKTLFLLDGVGAAWTAFSLFFIVRHFYEYVGMPSIILNYLSVIGLVYCVYSMLCYFLLKNSWTPYLRIIGVSNFLYCVLTMYLLYTHYNDLTRLGLAYFLAEIFIIMSLVYIELSVATILKSKKTY